jgi:hypothetical protein
MKCGKKKKKQSAPSKYSGREESGTDGANAQHSRHGFASARLFSVEDVAAWAQGL